MEMTKQELIEDFDLFLNETGNWQKFVNWLNDRGSTPADYGFEEEDNDDDIGTDIFV